MVFKGVGIIYLEFVVYMFKLLFIVAVEQYITAFVGIISFVVFGILMLKGFEVFSDIVFIWRRMDIHIEGFLSTIKICDSCNV